MRACQNTPLYLQKQCFDTPSLHFFSVLSYWYNLSCNYLNIRVNSQSMHLYKIQYKLLYKRQFYNLKHLLLSLQ